MIAYFAIICKGHVPFTLDWSKPDNVDIACLDPASAAYMVQMSELLRKQSMF